MSDLNGLSQINIEITSRCDKMCHFCGHQDPGVNNQLKFGDMDEGLYQKIIRQIPLGVVVQFHRDGEPLVHPHLGWILASARPHITSIVTNGKKLAEKANEIIGKCSTITVSMFKGDPDWNEQYENIKKFMVLKGGCSPNIFVKVVGDLEADRLKAITNLEIPIIYRYLHLPAGSFGYRKGTPTIPEHGICQDFLSHPSINWQGKMHVCNRLDPKDEGLLGDLNKDTLADIWTSKRRMAWLEAHARGNRHLASKLCRKCEFWGVPCGRQFSD